MAISSSRGFTLIELMTVIAVAAVLLLVAAPSMRGIIERNAVAGQVNALVGAVTVARAEAIKRNGETILCRSVNAETAATPGCDMSNSDWQSGWIVFLDRNANQSYNPSDGDVLLQVQGAFDDSGGIVNSASVRRLRFRNTGMLLSGNSCFAFDAVSLDARRKRQVRVSATGRARTSEDASC